MVAIDLSKSISLPGGVSLSPDGELELPAAGGIDWYLAGGIATCVAAYAAKNAASLAASYINLPNPGTYNAAPGTAPDWDAVLGWKCPTSRILTTGIIPASNWSLFAKYSDIGDSDRYVAGEFAANADFAMSPRLVSWH